MRVVERNNGGLRLVLLLWLCVSGMSVCAAGRTDSTELDWTGAVQNELRLIASEADSSYYTTGIAVYDLTADSILFVYNGRKQLRPASTQKLFTAITALDRLGARHNYTTSVYATGSLTVDSTGQSVLNGNIYIIGDFDPMLDNLSMGDIVSSIKNMGVSRIEGMLVADLSMKDSVMLGSGWCWDDRQPMLTPLSVGGDAYLCTREKLNRYSPSANFLLTLQRMLEADGVATRGCGIGDYYANDSSVLVCTVRHSIGDVLQRMMKESDNLYAESMYYQLAADRKKRVGWKDCRAVVEGVAAAAGIPESDVRVADGCGLSLYNYTTAFAEVLMLRYAYKKRETVFRSLYESLPVAGVDGTLKRRMKTGKAFRNVRAKTGTVTGVSSLAGYLTAANGHVLAFSIISNGLRKAAEGCALQDRICQVLCE